jgi:site-specific DNA-methyltransferase (adenine-specific)
LEEQIPDQQARINHIFKNQLYGIAITELTSLLARRSLYCSKYANSERSVCDVFDDEQGNVLFNRTQHTWPKKRKKTAGQQESDSKCLYCGASEKEHSRDETLETHAYQFIHTDKPQNIFGASMRFDVIIGNPPYQLSDGGFGTSAMPIYHRFVEQAIKLNPRFLSLIIPARWFSGGKGLDDFREEMLNDNRIREIHDFPDATTVFPGVQIKGGVCYFLWQRDERGICKVSSYGGDRVASVMERPLLEEGAETFIRYNEAISILKKVQVLNEPSLKEQVSSSKPFGFRTNFFGAKKQFKDAVELFQNGGTGYISKTEINANNDVVDKFKVFIPPLGSGSDSFPHPILGKPFLGKPNTACTETYIFIGTFNSEVKALNLISYVTTKFLRFLVLLNKPAQHATKKVYQFVPVQDFNEAWTDEKLYKKYGLTEEEISFIESMIRPMELADE